eukprot:s1619_g17.t1
MWTPRALGVLRRFSTLGMLGQEAAALAAGSTYPTYPLLRQRCKSACEEEGELRSLVELAREDTRLGWYAELFSQNCF